MEPEEEGKGNKRKLAGPVTRKCTVMSQCIRHTFSDVPPRLMFNICPFRLIWLKQTNVFPLCIRLQNVLEDFRDMDATALEETKATVRAMLASNPLAFPLDPP